jgi:hypothetical protein
MADAPHVLGNGGQPQLSATAAQAQVQATRASPELPGAAGMRGHGIGWIDRGARRPPWLLWSITPERATRPHGAVVSPMPVRVQKGSAATRVTRLLSSRSRGEKITWAPSAEGMAGGVRTGGFEDRGVA